MAAPERQHFIQRVRAIGSRFIHLRMAPQAEIPPLSKSPNAFDQEKVNFLSPQAEPDIAALKIGEEKYRQEWEIHTHSDKRQELVAAIDNANQRLEAHWAGLDLQRQGALRDYRYRRQQAGKESADILDEPLVPRRTRKTLARGLSSLKRNRRYDPMEGPYMEVRSREEAIRGANEALRSFDEDWAIAGNMDRNLLYVAENLMHNEGRRESLFVEFVNTHGGQAYLLTELFLQFEKIASAQLGVEGRRPDYLQARAERIWEGLFYGYDSYWYAYHASPKRSILFTASKPNYVKRTLRTMPPSKLRAMGVKERVSPNLNRWLNHLNERGYPEAERLEDEADAFQGYYKVLVGENKSEEFLFKIVRQDWGTRIVNFHERPAGYVTPIVPGESETSRL